ncbi:hypothetical protein BVER_03567 [Candidatus Burkholderia verschuerenii]|uniref:CCHC-type domain-containing protein n=1 Tax=Candidatus Burkholderia verschuerenii TaxID=242163 RepID=A0A0L0M2R1_9BURK|nr:hypothetical protein BVER_03567 [Candidatus Burkholderia verschuerenii]
MKGKEPQGPKPVPPKITACVKCLAEVGKGPAGKKPAASVVCRYCNKPGHVEADCWRKSNKCLRCGSADHRILKCPFVTLDQASAGTKPGVSDTAKKAKVPARVYTLGAEEEDKGASVVEGTLPIFGQVLKVLIDPDSTHSFINPENLEKLGNKVETLPFWVEIGTLMEMPQIQTDRVCKNCEVSIKGKIFHVDLILLPVRGYEVILGMDWLSRHYAQINCRTKEICFTIPVETILQYTLKPLVGTPEMISGEKARKLIFKGATGFLARLSDQYKDKQSVDQVEVVKEFVDVFPETLSSAPPDRELEFTIDLVPGVEPISKTSYRMAPAELQELKTQLQELLSQGFIRPST